MAVNNQPQRRPSTGARRPAAGNAQKRRKRKKNNNFLYLAAVMGFIFVGLLGFLILEISGCSDNDESSIEESIDTSENESKVITESFDESSKEGSHPIEESTPEVSKPDESEPPTKPIVHESTKKYEERVGIKYSIDMSEYEKYVCPDNEKSFVYLVNPEHTLASDYKPKNLVWCTNIRAGRPEQWSYIDATANKALEAFLKEAAHFGYGDITVTNAYRSYNSQASLFNGYVASDLKEDYYCDTCRSYIDISYFPKKVATKKFCNGCECELEDGNNYCEICMMDVTSPISRTVCATCASVVRQPTKEETTAHVLTYSTRPGTSEHQSGLCCDMHNMSTTTSAFDNTPEAKWLAKNAHRFGFILRYPPNTQHITGIKHESWHFRYVGRTAATEMYEKGLTLEEYLGDPVG